MRLVLSSGENLADDVPKDVSLSGKERFVIGRDRQANWVLLDAAKSISAVHCEIIFDGSKYVLRDMSTNGTFLNGSKERLEHPHSLRDGDLISVGPYVIKAVATAQPGAGLPPPVKPAESALAPPPIPRGGVSRGDPAAMVSNGPAAPAKTDTAEAPNFMTLISPAPKPTAPMPRGVPVVAKAVEEPPPPTTPEDSVTIAPGSLPKPVFSTSSASPKPAASQRPSAPPATALPAASPDWDVEPVASGGVAPSARPFLQGLGLAEGALADIEAEELAARLGALTRGLLVGLKDSLDEAARSRRSLGSRIRGMPRGQRWNALRFSARPEDALLALLSMSESDAAAETKQSFDELKDHQRAMLSAAFSAARSLGDDLDPGALAQGAANVGSVVERKARLWDTYCALWQGVDADWASGLSENFKLLMASHYDDQNKG